ncbi:phosphatase 2C family protein [Striga asiatica]|uniref:protein-serine/threonine phosphatase n=1 Tax=Striga asiatica TaxID=4170 RepID=A0A5A7P116_STRAF|nr:phosphatase 2C family protein [Striga asiatica]
MGGCVSISSRSTCSSKSNGDNITPPCLWIDMFGCKRSRRTFSDNVTNLQRLASASNRIFTNGRTSSSCIYTQQGRKGINQDAMIVWEDFMEDGVSFCGVFDGHGPHGHLVARKVRDTLPLKLSSFLNSSESKRNGSGVNCCNGDVKLDVVDPTKDTSEEEKVESMWREAFLKSYKAMDKELKSHPNLDCFCSGSTAVTVVKQGSNLFMGNIGDSRAILGSKDGNDSMVATQLTVDLKPDLPKEAERIKRCKGRVFALQDEPEVPRVWLPFDDAPGLAMARAFGDFCLKEYGVISIPEFSHRTLTDQDKFIVLASDGVWDVLSNEEVVEIVCSAPTRSSAARVVVESAAREWRSKYPTSKMDDCAVVCFFLDGKTTDTAAESEFEEQSFAGGFSSADDGQHSEPCLARNYTVRSSSEEKHEEQSWSGLEGVTRVNSLVQLPRFSEERTRT